MLTMRTVAFGHHLHTLTNCLSVFTSFSQSQHLSMAWLVVLHPPQSLTRLESLPKAPILFKACQGQSLIVYFALELSSVYDSRDCISPSLLTRELKKAGVTSKNKIWTIYPVAHQ